MGNVAKIRHWYVPKYIYYNVIKLNLLHAYIVLYVRFDMERLREQLTLR